MILSKPVINVWLQHLLLGITLLFAIQSVKLQAATESFTAGSAIINMGVLPQTVGNGLKPYGMIYDLIINAQIPVYWSINPAKTQDGIDFSVAGNDYRGGSFIIPATFVSEANAILATWQAKGVVVDIASSAFSAPIQNQVTSFPNTVIDLDRGSIVVPYYENAEIPSASYRLGTPSDLTSCDDYYAMPHADPAWATHQNLLPFVKDQGGHLWAACHAVSVLESLVDPLDPTRHMRFLSNDGLIIFGSHDAGTPAYSQAIANNPMAQYMGQIDAATENGSEQIYLPLAGGWRSSTKIAVWDPDHPDVPANSPGEAVKLAWGRAFGDPNAGMVMYEGGHSHAKGSADDVAAQRVYFSSLLHSGIEKRPEITVNSSLPADIDEGDVVPLSVTVSDGAGLYTYQWKSSCGGTFSNPNGASTTFTAPTTEVDLACNIRIVVTDVCNRLNFGAYSTVVHPVFLADLQISKTDNADPVGTGQTINYSLQVTNAGPDAAPNAVVTDDLSDTGTTLISASGSGWSCSGDPVVSCTTASLPVGVSTIDLVVSAPLFATTVSNTATVSSDAIEVDPANNSATETTEVQPRVDLAINKVVGPAVEVRAGEDYNFLISVDNVNGDEASTEIVMTDVLPAGAEYVSATGTGWSCGYDTPTRTVSCTLANGLPAGETAPLIELMVSSTEGGDYTNTANVDAPDSLDTNPANNSDSATRSVVAVTGLEINKLINNGNPVDGEAIVFTLLLTNYGPSTATDIRVTDPVPPYIPAVSTGFDGVSTPDNGTTTPNGGTISSTQTGNTLQWQISQLEVGETAALTIDATYRRAVFLVSGLPVDDGIIENTATIFEFGSNDVPQVLDPDLTDNLDTASVGSPEADVAVSKIATLDATAATPLAAAEVDRNASFAYVLDVTNNGGSDLSIRSAGTLETNLQVVDTLPAEISFVDLAGTDANWSCTSSGSPVTVSCDYLPAADETFASSSSLPPIVINVSAPGNSGELQNTVSVSYTNSQLNSRVDNNSTNDNFTLLTPVTAPQADLTLSKTVDNPNPAMGDTISYTIAIDNSTGPDAASGVQVSDTLPAGVTLLTATASQGSYNGGVWAVGDLLFGQAETLVITARVDSAARITNNAEITALNEEDPNPDGIQSATIDVNDADLALSKVVSAAPVAPDTAPLTVGQSVEFTITLTNNGSVDGLGNQVATNVVVSDVLPNGLTIVDASNDITTSIGSATLNSSGNEITWQLPAIAVGASNRQAMVVKARVDSNAELINNASITAADFYDATTANNSDSATVDVVEAELSVVKTMVNERVVNPGDSAEFLITITNNGPDLATGVSLLDQLPAELTVVNPLTDISVSGGSTSYDAVNDTIDWTLGNLANGATATLNVITRVDDTGTLTNTATLTGTDQSDSNPNNNSDQVIVLSGGNADLTLTKVIDDPSVTIGDTVTFTLSMVNNGPDAATGIVAKDILPAALTAVSGTPSKGVFDPLTGLWNGFGLLNGETATLIITADTTNTGQYNNVGLILESEQGDPDPVNDLANAAYEVFPAGTLVNLSGSLYYDSSDDGSLNGAETGIGTTAFVKLVSAADPSFAVEYATVNSSTGAYNFNGIPAGDYTLLVDDNSASSDTTASSPGGWTFRTPANGSLPITVAGADISNQNFGFLLDIQLSTEAGSVVINEVAAKRLSDNETFVEIYNNSANPVSIGNWQLGDGNPYLQENDGATSFTGDANNPAYLFPAGTTLGPYEYAVVWLGANNADNQAPEASFQSWLDTGRNLKDKGDELWLLDASNHVVDYIAWGSGNELNTPPPASLGLWNDSFQADLKFPDKGHSLSLTANGVDGNSSACWEATSSGDASGRCGGALPTIIGSQDSIAGRTSSAGLNNNGLGPSLGVPVSGYLYLDANHNGLRDSGETGTANSTIVLLDTVSSTCSSVQTDSDGYYQFSSVSDGQYQLIAAAGETTPAPASCPAAEADETGLISTTINSREITVAGVGIANQNFGDFNGSVVRGTVFIDNGAGAGTAYNALLDGAEAASAEVSLGLYDGPTLIESTLTDASGNFELWIPASVTTASVRTETPSGYLSVSEAVGNTDASVDSDFDEIVFTATAGTVYAGLAFGDVATPAFAPDHKRRGLAGSFVLFPHTFTSATSGAVTFSVINPVATPDINGWATVLYRDSDCDGELASSDPVIDAAINVDADTNNKVCIIAKVLIPAQADVNAQYLIEMQSSMQFSGSTIADHEVVRTDLTTVGTPTDAGLAIFKSVDKASALPGETLRYTIVYRNTSREPLDDIVVNDSTPVFTHFVSASCITPLPDSLTACVVTEQPAVDGKGAIKWTLTGELAPGTEGSVVYEVELDY